VSAARRTAPAASVQFPACNQAGGRHRGFDGRAAADRLYFRMSSAITPPSRDPAHKGCRGCGEVLNQHTLSMHRRRTGAVLPKCVRPEQESKMPKLKTKSGAKKRFKITATGKVLYAQSRKRHGMIKRTKKAIRQLRGTSVLFKTDGDNIKRYFLPNG
jgi:large subunit ribosomal protein L35